MQLFEAINRISRVHMMIMNESTGTPEEFANKLNISRRQLFNILEDFKSYGAQIKYSRKKRAYSYQNNFIVRIEVGVFSLSKQEQISISGGFSINKLFNAVSLH
ncbi:MAG: hypothetical protein ACK5KL_03505 [Dysgonomonas sp.]